MQPFSSCSTTVATVTIVQPYYNASCRGESLCRSRLFAGRGAFKGAFGAISVSSLYNVRNTRLQELGEGVRGEEQGVGGGEHGGEQQAAKSGSGRSCELS